MTKDAKEGLSELFSFGIVISSWVLMFSGSLIQSTFPIKFIGLTIVELIIISLLLVLAIWL
jgi:hypothetical protein